ncbi:hypothetical protein MKR46_06435 [Staphylococcus haemolyticus]|uniref:Uncharacterized protein n=2 Tax=Staphylococcus haemolyticus TaxID=1283 RepID=A0A2K0AY30_STAHA|nr:hypothetical protein [Staphylococcus haemolyticus]MCH4443609.1 hypothetical protein [Staphylococcus haemolyticus]PNN29951.1 hypothetical protein AL503_001285 [Staphylococcus haemolyticus]
MYIIYFIRIKKYSKNNPAFLNSMKYSFTRNRLIHKNHFTSSNNRINEANKVKNEVATVLNEIDIYKRISEKYCNAYAASKMYDYFLTYRADNIKEAINLFELEEHQSRLEAKQDYIIKQNDQIQIDVLASRYTAELAARESRKAKISASNASLNSFLNLLKNNKNTIVWCANMHLIIVSAVITLIGNGGFLRTLHFLSSQSHTVLLKDR